MIKTLRITLGLLAGAALLAQAPKGKDPGRTQTTPKSTINTLAPAERTFLQQAAESGHREVRMAQLAQSRAAMTEVRDFANMLIRDHSRANEEISRFARQHGVQLAEYTSSADRAGKSAATSGQSSAKGKAKTTTPPPDPKAQPPAQQAERSAPGAKEAESNYTELSRLSGSAFDRRYIDLQVSGHRTGISRFEAIDRTGQNQQLKQFVQNTLPILRGHLQQAEALQQRLRETKQ